MRDQSLIRIFVYNISSLTLTIIQTELMTIKMTTTTDHVVEVHHGTTTIIKITPHNTDTVLHHEIGITLTEVLLLNINTRSRYKYKQDSRSYRSPNRPKNGKPMYYQVFDINSLVHNVAHTYHPEHTEPIVLLYLQNLLNQIYMRGSFPLSPTAKSRYNVQPTSNNTKPQIFPSLPYSEESLKFYQQKQLSIF